jgi:hypothetical protein
MCSRRCRFAGSVVPRIDRLRLLLVRERCKAALSDPELCDEIRALYKRAMDHAEVALGLDSARARLKPPIPRAADEPRG